MKYLSLFSGVGMLDYGFYLAGMECIHQCEINPYCQKILSLRFPEVSKSADVEKLCRRCYDCNVIDEDTVWCPRCDMDFGDCECIGTDQFLDEIGQPELIVGGDPCQQHTNARTHGKIPKSYGSEFIRIVTELYPRFVLRENPAVIRRDAEWSAARFADALNNIGYECCTFQIKACCAGADHRRKRMFVFAALQNADGTRLQGDVCKIVAHQAEGRQDTYTARSNWRDTSPRICRGTDGITHRVDRLKSIGNGVDVRVAYRIGKALMSLGCVTVSGHELSGEDAT